jgi:hypothetical protein
MAASFEDVFVVGLAVLTKTVTWLKLVVAGGVLETAPRLKPVVIGGSELTTTSRLMLMLTDVTVSVPGAAGRGPIVIKLVVDEDGTP